MKVLLGSTVRTSLLLPLLLCGTVLGQNLNNVALSFVPAPPVMGADVNLVVPSTVRTTFVPPHLIGFYGSDGKYRNLSDRSARNQNIQDPARINARSEVPPWIDRRPPQHVVEDMAPPYHARKTYKGQSWLANFRDKIITAAYGSEDLMVAPHRIIVDAQQRLIVLDTTQPAIHVFSATGSFSILAGRGHRLVQPDGIAVDRKGNIYVSDDQSALILVYDPAGRYLRSIGDYSGESIFAKPTSIAIQGDRLFVLDTPENQLIVLNLQGRVIKRIGSRRDTRVKFDAPSEVAVSSTSIVVLDAAGSRVRQFDSDLNLRSEFLLATSVRDPGRDELAMALDRVDNIYISNTGWSNVRVFRPNGERVGTVGVSYRSQDLVRPSGICIDSSNHLYVSDSVNHRVQVFESPQVVASSASTTGGN